MVKTGAEGNIFPHVFAIRTLDSKHHSREHAIKSLLGAVCRDLSELQYLALVHLQILRYTHHLVIPPENPPVAANESDD